MCYTSDNLVNLKTEVTYDENLPYGANGYRTDCNNIQVNSVSHTTLAEPTAIRNTQKFIFQIGTLILKYPRNQPRLFIQLFYSCLLRYHVSINSVAPPIHI